MQGAATVTVALITIVMCAAVLAAASTPSMHSRDTSCSLGGASDSDDPLESMCQLNSTLGLGPTSRVLARFGETGCRVQVKRCAVGECYVAMDGAIGTPPDVGAHSTDVTPASMLSEVVDVVGARVVWNSNGVYVMPTSSSFAFTYSTVTCAEFYAARGYLAPPDCAAPREILGRLVAGLPVDCSSLFS